MNRPTIELDELLEIADEAIAAGDRDQAVAILRQAAAVAPLRKDIRNRIALVLEGTPVAAKPPRKRRERAIEADFSSDFDAENGGAIGEETTGGREAITQIARKAFDAAVQQKDKAGSATRRLSNLLQSGLDTWKSSLTAQLSSNEKKPAAEPVEATAQSMVFRPEDELQQYMERASAGLPAPAFNDIEIDDAAETETDISRITRPASVSKKTGRPASSRSSAKRPSDVEDVLAAGIGGFIDAMGRVDKTKVAYTAVYVMLVGLFGFACFDVAKKFPQVAGESGQSIVVNAASAGSGLDLGKVTDSADAVAEARKMAATGKADSAIIMLRAQLKRDNVLQNRDMLRVELATLLNSAGESHLTGNRISESVAAYREAHSYLPNDSKLQLRFANALYYEGLMVATDPARKKKILKEAEALLTALVAKDTGNVQAHRLLALIHEAADDKGLAKASWQKVKSLAPKESAILAEAVSHLK